MKMDKRLISILLITLFFTGCSTAPQKKKSFLSEKQQAELKDIVNRNLTEDDWDKYQQEWQKNLQSMREIGALLNKDDFNIDIRNDYDKDPMTLMRLMEMSQDKPILRKELTSFMHKLAIDNGFLPSNIK